MDGYRDLYRAPVSAGYYTSTRFQPGYGIEGRSSYGLSADPLLSAYARVPSDAYVGYAAYQPELLRFHRDAAPLRSLSPRPYNSHRRRSSAQTGGKRRPPPPQNFAPKKTTFKKTRKGLPVEISTPKKGSQRTALQKRPLQKDQEVGELAGKSLNFSATSLAKETQELHSLYRTGVDPSTGKKLVKPSVKKADETPLKQSTRNARGQKRKADAQKKDEAPPSAKKSKGKKKKKLAKKKQQEDKKDEKPVISTPKAVNVELPVLTEEEVAASLALQNAACKAVGEFLGIPDKKEEAEKSEAPDASSDEAKPVEAEPSSEGEVQAKPEEASKQVVLTPDEEKELEEEGYKFFSKLLEENQELRNLYLEKKDVGTFECLVCRSVDPETSKKFANLTNLVMHTSMRKQKRPEHRGYGRTICEVLGWESLRAPKRSAKQVQQEGDVEKQSEVEEVPEEGKPGES